MKNGNFAKYTLGVSKVFLIGMGLVCTQAFATPGNPEHSNGPVATACAEEITKFCADKKHVNREVRTCLEAHKSQLSDSCKKTLETTGSDHRYRHGGN